MSLPFVIKFAPLILLIGTIIVDIGDASLHLAKTGEWHPLADATAGRLLAADYQIYQNMQRLQGESLVQGDRVFLKKEIFINAFLYFFFVWIIAFFFKTLFSSVWTWIYWIPALLVGILFAAGFEALYVLLIERPDQTFIPLYTLIKFLVISL